MTSRVFAEEKASCAGYPPANLEQLKVEAQVHAGRKSFYQ